MNRTDYVLPRYVFRGTEVGCGHERHSPTCLCDVEVDAPAPIHRGDLMFGALALEEVDADTVSPRNFVEFASVLLGCYEEYLRCPPADLMPYEAHDLPYAVTLDREVRTTTAHQALTPVAQTRSGSAVKLAGHRSKTPLRGGYPACWLELDEDVRNHLRFHWTVGTPWSRLSHLVPVEYLKQLGLYYRRKATEYRGWVKYANKRGEQPSREVSV